MAPSTSVSDAKQCPWCTRWCLKDAACNYIFACGLDERNQFHIGKGCGRSWCWQCGKKFCGRYYDINTGTKLPTAKENHDARCCEAEPGFSKEEFCPGGHNSHCESRW